jgi:hypothetical protein
MLQVNRRRAAMAKTRPGGMTIAPIVRKLRKHTSSPSDGSRSADRPAPKRQQGHAFEGSADRRGPSNMARAFVSGELATVEFMMTGGWHPERGPGGQVLSVTL